MLEGKQMPCCSHSEAAPAVLCSGTTCGRGGWLLNTVCSPLAAVQPGQVDPHDAAPDATGTLGAVSGAAVQGGKGLGCWEVGHIHFLSSGHAASFQPSCAYERCTSQ